MCERVRERGRVKGLCVRTEDEGVCEGGYMCEGEGGCVWKRPALY